MILQDLQTLPDDLILIALGKVDRNLLDMINASNVECLETLKRLAKEPLVWDAQTTKDFDAPAGNSTCFETAKERYVEYKKYKKQYDKLKLLGPTLLTFIEAYQTPLLAGMNHNDFDQLKSIKAWLSLENVEEQRVKSTEAYDDLESLLALLTTSNGPAGQMLHATPLKKAAIGGYLEVTKALLAHPTMNVHNHTVSGIPLLRWIGAEASPEIQKAFLAQPGIDPNTIREDNGTPLLHGTAFGGPLPSLKFILSFQLVNLNIIDPNTGLTTLSWAATNPRYLPQLKMLLQDPRIDATVPNRDGSTALSRAIESRNYEAIYLIHRHLTMKTASEYGSAAASVVRFVYRQADKAVEGMKSMTRPG